MYFKTSCIGFPTIGKKRELKFLIEKFWKNEIDESALESQAIGIIEANLKIQQALDLIPLGDFSFYDRMLDQTILFGLIPPRFGAIKEFYELYFAMARGKNALEMTKWFNTNYHYLIPELEEAAKPALNYLFLEKISQRYQKHFNSKHKFCLIGPHTFIKLAKGYRSFEQWFLILSKIYLEFLGQLKEQGLIYVQLEEPQLTKGCSAEELKLLRQFLAELQNLGLKVILQTYFERVPNLKEILSLPYFGLGLDFVSNTENLSELKQLGWPKDKALFAGVINGRNIWRADLRKTSELLQELSGIGATELYLQPSCSLLHVPVSAKNESELPRLLKDQLAFALEKLAELQLLKEQDTVAIEESASLCQKFARAAERSNKSVKQKAAALKEADFKRSLPFAQRKVKQQKKLKLPLLPTTTIGSFPQTAEVRKIRHDFRAGKISRETYLDFIKEKTISIIRQQEEIGLDVLVHGEYERTDMVEFFGEKLTGFATTLNGWVQSYGSRCVKPPIIWADVARKQPMTVSETTFAQSLTSKPVKGMLTGPVTILQWSFVRDDLERSEVTKQIALALREETLDLEKSGIKIIQIDEPALKEGEPLDQAKVNDYYKWAVAAFKLASSGVKDETQIHTHMCYAEFNDIIGHIAEMDADVISMESARSKEELLDVFKTFNYRNDIGPGVYDIHSPYVPTSQEIKEKIKRNLKYLRPEQLWVNPDCGLKTRKEEEVIPALKNMVNAVSEIRKKRCLALD